VTNRLARLPAPGGVLVLGGTGFLGRTLVAELVGRAGAAHVVVPTRRIAHARVLRSLPDVECIEADVHDDAALAALVERSTAVVNLIAILHGSDSAFQRVHIELPRRLAAACSAAGVRRVVHVSALGVSADAPSRYLRSKAAGEAVLRQAPQLEWTLLRPSLMFGADDRLLNLFASLQAVLPVLPLAGAGAQVQPVWVHDVARGIVQCLADRSTIGQTFECAGPRRMTLRELAELAGRWSGHPRPIIPVPDAIAGLQASLFELLPGDPLLSHDNLDSLKVPNVASGALPGLARLGIEPTALEAVAPSYLGARAGARRLDRWRAVAKR
jgi:NADH dehydrogenase